MDFEEVIGELKRNKKYFFSENDLFSLGLSKKDVKSVIKTGLRKNVLVKLTKNIYYLSDLAREDIPFEVVVDKFFGGSGYYLGLGYALKYWGFKAEGVETVIFNRKKHLDNFKVEMDKYKFYFKFMDTNLFFGEIRVPANSSMVNISDFEKTFLDTLIFLGKEVSLKSICGSIDLLKEKLNAKKFARYVLRPGNKDVVKRAGFILDKLLGFREGDLLVNHIDNRRILLDPNGPKKGDVDDKWSIVVNTNC